MKIYPMKYNDFIKNTLDESAEVKQAIAAQCSEMIERAGLLLSETFRNGGKVLLCGNGGSAADSQHIATEFVVRLSAKLNRAALPAMALTTNSSTITACSNDYGFDMIFSRQIEAFGKKGDVLIGISTSGNSMNVIKAFESARELDLRIIGLIGGSGGDMKGMAEVDIIIPHEDTARIQEGHITVGHILCEIVERELF
ncbi:D-sedoheptulose 7-phosphate isomerase [candidate division KSB1 bacterium]